MTGHIDIIRDMGLPQIFVSLGSLTKYILDIFFVGNVASIVMEKRNASIE